MAIAGSIRSGSDGKYAWRRAPLAFPGVNEGPGVEAEDAGSDRDEIQLLELIERDGIIRTETLDGDWE